MPTNSLSPRGDDGTEKAEATSEAGLVTATEGSTERTESQASQPLQEILTEMVEGAIEAKVVIYDRPDTLDYALLDAPIREACRIVNASGWVFTAESCSGHPDATYKYAWGFNRPYLRLTCHTADAPRLLDTLTRASISLTDDEGLPLTMGLQIWRYPDKQSFAQFGVYAHECGTVYWRDMAMRLFERFGEMCEPHD